MYNQDMEVKKHVLNMLRDVMMGSDGGKFKPKMVEVEITKGVPAPMEGKEGLADVLESAAKAKPMEMEDNSHPEPDGDEIPSKEIDGELCDDEMEPKQPMSLKDYLRSRK